MMLLIGLLRNVEDCLRANMMLLIGLLHDVEDCLLQKWAACILYQLSLDLSTKFPQVFLGPDQLSPWNSRPEDLLISSLCVIFRFSFKKDSFLLPAFASSGYSSGTLLPSLHIFYISLNFRVFWPHHAACGILVAQPGIEPAPPALELRSLNHWGTREVPRSFLNF